MVTFHLKHFSGKYLIIPIVLEKVTSWYIVMLINLDSVDLYFYPMLPQLWKEIFFSYDGSIKWHNDYCFNNMDFGFGIIVIKGKITVKIIVILLVIDSFPSHLCNLYHEQIWVWMDT